jgi:predicted dehydrogenase
LKREAKAHTRVGVIGVGKMGALHLEKYLGLAHVEVVGIFDPSAERCQAVLAKYGVRAISSLSELLFEADAVTIASPTATHFSIAKQALEAGVHVLVEKPVTERPDEGEQLVQLAKSRNLIFQVGFVERFRYLALSSEILPAPIRFIESERLSPSLGREAAIDVVSDLMIHDLDLALSLIPEEPSFISAIGVPVLTPLYDVANVRLEFPSGAVVELNASRVSLKPLRKIRIFSLNSYASVDFITNTADVYSRNSKNEIEHRSYESARYDALAEQCADFIRCIEHKRPPLVSGADGVKALRIARMIREKIEERAVWKIPTESGIRDIESTH